jgi:palmitoyl-protein thioesterase
VCVSAKFLHLFFPSLTCEEAYELFYSSVGQHTSVGNYWNDPHHQELYYKYSAFLPYVNNQLNDSAVYREALTKLNRMVLIGGPDDEVITPWQSRYPSILFISNWQYLVTLHTNDTIIISGIER